MVPHHGHPGLPPSRLVVAVNGTLILNVPHAYHPRVLSGGGGGGGEPWWGLRLSPTPSASACTRTKPPT
ncbi:hypothetical protein CSHISOI_11645 [Colletotrichum shisoi]|uniref:Uncharacterized protein n=1 Tax=Colletotrichum shisoi TaxID=2078593 RepID=A0A5Q4BA27_9PEZI|nr:hypothetical protein CSHISOI_11645 [Colletotrichum shisoi]